MRRRETYRETKRNVESKGKEKINWEEEKERKSRGKRREK